MGSEMCIRDRLEALYASGGDEEDLADRAEDLLAGNGLL